MPPFSAMEWFGHLGEFEQVGPTGPPVQNFYVAEDGVTFYVAEDGVSNYVPEH